MEQFEDAEEQEQVLEPQTTYTCYNVTSPESVGAAPFIAWGKSTRGNSNFQSNTHVLSDATPPSSSLVSFQTEPGMQRASTATSASTLNVAAGGSGAGFRRGAAIRSDATTTTATKKFQPFVRSSQLSQVTITSSDLASYAEVGKDSSSSSIIPRASSFTNAPKSSSSAIPAVEPTGGRKLMKQRTRNGGNERRRNNNESGGQHRSSRRSIDYDAPSDLASGSQRRSIDYDPATARRSLDYDARKSERRSIDYDPANARRSIEYDPSSISRLRSAPKDTRRSRDKMMSSARRKKQQQNERKHVQQKEEPRQPSKVVDASAAADDDLIAAAEAGRNESSPALRKSKSDVTATRALGKKDSRKLKKAVKTGANVMGVLFVGSSHLK